LGLAAQQDSKALDSNPIFLGPTSWLRANGSCVRNQLAWILCQDPTIMDYASGSISLRYCVRTQFSWIEHQDPRVMGYASRSKGDESFIKIHFAWVLPPDPRFLDLMFLNIIICVINIVIFIIIKSINIKSIIIFIIINIIYKIINKFEKQLLSILKNNPRFDLEGKIKNYYCCCCYYYYWRKNNCFLKD
jgi:hypothetical protein